MASPLQVEIKYKGVIPNSSEKAIKIIDDEMRKGIEKVLMWLWRKIVNKTPGHTGTLQRSITTRIEGFGLNLQGIVGSPSEYALPVEKGRRAGTWPNIDALKTWVRQKLKVSESDVDKVSYLIADKIRFRGIPPVGMFEKTYNEEKATVLRFLDEALARVTQRLRGTA